MLKLILNTFIKLISIMPLPMVRGLGYVVGFVFGNVIRHHRTDALLALERSIPELTPRECKRTINTMYHLQGVNFMELIWYSTKDRSRLFDAVEVENEHYITEALSRGKGVLALTAHFGNFELLTMATGALGYKMTVIVKPIKTPAVNEAMTKLRDHEGLTFLDRDNAYRDCLKALRRNEFVGMIIDQNMIRESGIFVDFFGRPACTSPGLAYMSAQSKAPVLPVFIHKKSDGRFLLKVQKPIDPPVDRSPEVIQAATQLYTKVIESAVREDPKQWIWMHRRWKTTPVEGEAGFVRAKKS
ncbi:lysophospholipid acyltransferase family protein [Pontiellaceae bacterium B1224]|nr:lysophospholipid acyltransferase family protein [Pontiellaceae bacterium B1224]